MGYKHDQNPFPNAYQPPSEGERLQEQSPPLRRRSSLTPTRPNLDNLSDHPADAPPPYSETAPIYHSQPLTNSWTAQDPRSSSTQSLVPRNDFDTDGDGNRTDGKRTLLLVYIHGFMGNETSFQSFPAHVHNLVSVKLEGSHVVHTKIYPKYKSRKAIEFARDAFSEWLSPHEGPSTDVVLLGHSMGGLLSAEVALLKKNRIVGTINFDTPFLGMHPGVIASGLGSLFRPAPDSPVPPSAESRPGVQGVTQSSTNDGIQSSSSSSSYFGSEAILSTLMPTDSNSIATTPLSSAVDLPTKDPNFDPPFSNDVRLPQRTAWSNAWHFLNKHSDDLRKATQSYVKSHLEFGGVMADYNGLKNRYRKIRSLEDVEPPGRIRFVNYYTASTGRPKKLKEPSPCPSKSKVGRLGGDSSQTPLQMHEASSSFHPPYLNPQMSKEEQSDEELVEEDPPNHEERSRTHNEDIHDDGGTMSDANRLMDHLHPTPMADDEDGEEEVEHCDTPAALKPSKSNTTSDSGSSNLPSSSPPSISAPPSRVAPLLPPIPAAPEEPAPFDPGLYSDDKDTRKLAEKEHSRQVKAYRQATKDRDKAIADRRKFIEKREKNAVKEKEKVERAEQKKEKIKAGQQRGLLQEEKENGEREKAAKADCKAERKRNDKAEKERLKAKKKQRAKADDDDDDPAERRNAGEPKRDRKFCMLPPKDHNGLIDPCWRRVFMPGLDEVGAHCGLFFSSSSPSSSSGGGERYAWFVDDVAVRIVEWVGGCGLARGELAV